MSAELSIEATEHKARELLDNRIDAVRALVTSRQHVTDAQEALKQAEDIDVVTYNKAIKAGWTANELKKLDLPEPDKKTRTRRRPPQRRPSTTSATTNTTTQAPTSAPGSAPTDGAPTEH